MLWSIEVAGHGLGVVADCWGFQGLVSWKHLVVGVVRDFTLVPS